MRDFKQLRTFVLLAGYLALGHYVISMPFFSYKSG